MEQRRDYQRSKRKVVTSGLYVTIEKRVSTQKGKEPHRKTDQNASRGKVGKGANLENGKRRRRGRSRTVRRCENSKRRGYSSSQTLEQPVSPSSQVSSLTSSQSPEVSYSSPSTLQTVSSCSQSPSQADSYTLQASTSPQESDNQRQPVPGGVFSSRPREKVEEERVQLGPNSAEDVQRVVNLERNSVREDDKSSLETKRMSVGVIGGPCENGVTGNHRSMGEVSKGVEVFFSSGFPEEQNQYLIPGFFTDALTVGENVLGIPTACVLTDGGIGFGGLLHIAIADKWIEILKERDKDGKMEDGVNTLTTRRWMKKCATYVDSNDHALGGEGVVLFWGALAKKLVEDDPQTNAMEGSDPRHGHPCVTTSTMICRGETIRSQVPPKEREISWERSHIRPGREIYLFISNCAYHSFTNSVGALAGDCRGCWDESYTNIKVSTNEVIPLSIVQKRYGIHMVSSQKVDAELVVKDGSLVNCEIKSGSQHLGVESPEMRYVVILDLPREPACILPAEDRVLRQGKENAFKISIFCAKDTSDEVSWQNLNKSLHRVSSGVNGKYEAVQEIEVDIVYHLERTVGSEEKLYRRKNGDSLSHATENKELNKRMTKGNQEQNESYAYPSFSPANNLEQATTDTNHCDCLMVEALNPNGKVFPLHVIKLKYWEGRGARMKLNSMAIFLLPP